MTIKEFNNLPFRFVESRVWKNEYTATYATMDNYYSFCIHAPRSKHNDKIGKTYRHWRIGKRVFRDIHIFKAVLANCKP